MKEFLFTLLLLTFGAGLSIAQNNTSQQNLVLKRVDESTQPVTFFHWINQHQYSTQAKKNKTQEKVIADFVDDKDDFMKDPVLELVDESAQPAGGMDTFFTWIGQHIKYPAQAKKNKTQGKVIVAFVIDKDGSIKDVEVIRGPGDGLDEEAVRVLAASPAWKPAKHQDRVVKQRMILPISFKL